MTTYPIGVAREFADNVEDLARAAQHIIYGDVTPETVRRLALALGLITGVDYLRHIEKQI